MREQLTAGSGRQASGVSGTLGDGWVVPCDRDARLSCSASCCQGTAFITTCIHNMCRLIMSEFLRAQGSQSGVSVWQHTLVG